MRQRVIEKFVVSGPPERIVDNIGTFQRQALQSRAIEGDLVRDAVDHQIVLWRRVVTHAAERYVFGHDRAIAALVDVSN